MSRNSPAPPYFGVLDAAGIPHHILQIAFSVAMLVGISPVVAQDWKWLFIYPDEGIASVNELAFPAAVPLNLKITSDTVMNSFFLPALSGQIYAMAGMQTQLNLMAGAPGRFRGRNTQYSGDGFSDQHFDAIAMAQDDFAAWVEKVRRDGETLDAESYAELAKPSIAEPVGYYATVEPGLFEGIIRKYAGSGAHAAAEHLEAESQ